MKTFNFNLDKLLRYRVCLEQREKLKFVKILQKYLAIENKIEKLLLSKKNLIIQKNKAINNLDFTTLAFYDKLMKINQSNLAEMIFFLEKQKKPLEKAKLELNKFIAARKSIEILKNKARLEYDIFLLAKQQEEIDEIVACGFDNNLDKVCLDDINLGGFL